MTSVLVQFDCMDLLSKGPTITNFLIYGWIEQPNKQEVLQETMDLLVKKVLVPYTGDALELSEGLTQRMLRLITAVIWPAS